jgi:hypothetical protein
MERPNPKHRYKNFNMYSKMESTLLSWPYCDIIQGKTRLQNKFALLVHTGSIRGDHYWRSREGSLKLIELSSINKVSLV